MLTMLNIFNIKKYKWLYGHDVQIWRINEYKRLKNLFKCSI